LAWATAFRRRRLLNSLRFQLLMGSILIIILSSAFSAALVTYSVTERFESIVARPSLGGSASSCPTTEVCLVIESDAVSAAVRQEFITSATNAVLIVLVTTGVITLALLAVLVIPRLRTIGELILAARQLADGHLDKRVNVQANDEISELARSFNAMADNLERVEGLRRTMVSDIAHELRTPLSNIQGYMEGLRDGVIPARPELFESLYQESMLLTRLVGDLQVLALADAGQLSLHRTSSSLAALVKNVALSLRDANPGQASITIKPMENLPRVYIDPDRIKQVLGNLLTNALAHTPPHGRITVEAAVSTTHVALKVSDTGEGIDPDHLPYVFERFYRADASRTRVTGGTGIGLAIVKQLIHAHGGTVEVESRLGAGSVFTFTLPIDKP
jgi:signal transduction histidine kinase